MIWIYLEALNIPSFKCSLGFNAPNLTSAVGAVHRAERRWVEISSGKIISTWMHSASLQR